MSQSRTQTERKSIFTQVQIPKLSPVDQFPVRKEPQERFDQKVKTSMTQLHTMVDELNTGVIPAMNGHIEVAQYIEEHLSEIQAAPGYADRAEKAASRAELNAQKGEVFAAQTKENAEEAKGAADRAVAVAGVDLATVEKAGLVRPDGDSITVDKFGVIKSGKLVTMLAPTIEGGDTIPLGQDVPYTFRAVPGLQNTQIAEFRAAIAGREEKTCAATGNAAETTFNLDIDVGEDVEVKMTVYAVDTLGNKSLTAEKTLTTVIGSVTPPVFESPAEGEAINPVNITWKLGAFDSSGMDDTHVATEYRITDADGTVLYTSGVVTDTAKLTTWTAAEPGVGSGAFRMQAAYKGSVLGWSQWATVNVTVKGVKAPTITAPTAGAEISKYYVTLGTSGFVLEAGGIADTHEATDWRITSPDGQTVYYDTESTSDLTRLVLPTLSVPDNTPISITARHKGAKMGWSPWSAARLATVVPHVPMSQNNEYTTAGNNVFVVPEDITEIRVLVVGAGAGGQVATSRTGGTGGKGGAIVSAKLFVTPGQRIPFTVGAVGSSGAAGGASTFGSWITAGGGTLSSHGSGTTNISAAQGSVICNLYQTPCASYLSCKSFEEMSLNKWSYDRTFSAGGNGFNGGSTKDYSGGVGGSGSAGHVSAYGIGGNGGKGGYGGGLDGSSGTCGAGGRGGNGGYGGGVGGNGGNGGDGGNGGRVGGRGGRGGNGGASSARGGNGGDGGISGAGDARHNSSGSGGEGGDGGTYGGIGGNGGYGSGDSSDGYSGAGGGGGSAGYGGNGGNGGPGGSGGGNGDSLGGSGGNGGRGCVVVFF